MDFKSQYTFESTAFPGVVVTLKRLGPKRRAEVELSVSAARARQRELSIRHEATRDRLIAAVDASPKDADGKPIEAQLLPEALTLSMQLQALHDEAEALARAQIHPAFLKAAVKSFGGEGLTYQSAPATADLLCDFGPDELFDELVAAVNGNGYISVEAARNLPLPSTSGAQADGELKTTTAPNANPEGSTASETVEPFIPSM